MKPKILISACLLGTACRYDGMSKKFPKIEALAEKYDFVPVCPEIIGGLPTPRTPSEISGGRVINADGVDVTAQYSKGAEKALEIAVREKCVFAVLKSRSPSCGKLHIYDGTFTHTLVDGEGVTAKLLRENGIEIFSEEDI